MAKFLNCMVIGLCVVGLGISNRVEEKGNIRMYGATGETSQEGIFESEDELYEDYPWWGSELEEAGHAEEEQLMSLSSGLVGGSSSQPLYMRRYFNRLTRDRIIANYDDSCGYTAAAMLLSYYDSFWDDSFVPEAHEARSFVLSLNDSGILFTSPGVLSTHSAYDPNGGLSFEQYANGVRNSDTMFGSLLRLMYPNSFPSDKNSFSINSHNECCILRRYLESVPSLSGVVLSKTWCDFGELGARNMAVNCVKAGIPCVVAGYNDVAGHDCIAYDYDESTDILYGHMGFYHSDSSENRHRNLGAYFTEGITECYALDVSALSHSHSDNYISLTGSACSCQLASHSHIDSYEYENTLYHTSSCFCGYFLREEHDYVRISPTADMCSKCGHIVLR